jgi:hypothetical protein
MFPIGMILAVFIGEMTTTQPFRDTSDLLGSVTLCDAAVRLSTVRGYPTHVAHCESLEDVLRIPIRASVGFRLTTLAIASAWVLVARIAH